MFGGADNSQTGATPSTPITGIFGSRVESDSTKDNDKSKTSTSFSFNSTPATFFKPAQSASLQFGQNQQQNHTFGSLNTSTGSDTAKSVFGSIAANPSVFSSPQSVFGNNGTPSSFGATNQTAQQKSIFETPGSKTIFGAASAFGSTNKAVFGMDTPVEKQKTIFGQSTSAFAGIKPPTGDIKPSFTAPAVVVTVPDTPKTSTKPAIASSVFGTPQSNSKEQSKQLRFNAQQTVGTKWDELRKARELREDKYYQNHKPTSLLEAKAVLGTCMDMCPEFERYDREFSQELHFFEMVAGTETEPIPRVDHQLAVKKYRRSAAGKDPNVFPEDIRPPRVLLKTMDYLIDKILPRTNVDYIEIYNFIRDRGRAIRKDFKVQDHLKGPECVSCLERLGRFLIHSDFMLCDLPESKYSWKQNRHQIIDTLNTLMDVYDEDSQNGHFYPNEAEFRSYFILLMIDDSAAVDKFQAWRRNVTSNQHVSISLKIHQLYQMSLFEPFFHILSQNQLSYLQSCIVHSIISKIRFDAVKCLFSSLSSRERILPISILQTLLLFDDNADTKRFCEELGMKISDLSGEMTVKCDGRSWPEFPKFTIHKSRFVNLKVPKSSPKNIVDGTAFGAELFAPEAVTQLDTKSSNLTFGKPGSGFLFKPQAAQIPATLEPAKVEMEKEAALRKQQEDLRSKLEQEAQRKKEVGQIRNDQSVKCSEDLITEVSLHIAREISLQALDRQSIVREYSKNVANSIVETCVKEELASVSIVEVSRYETRKETSRNEATLMTNNVTAEISREIVLECLSEKYCTHTLKRSSFNLWRNYCRIRVQSRQRKAQAKRKMMDNLRSIGSHTTVNEVPVIADKKRISLPMAKIRMEVSPVDMGVSKYLQTEFGVYMKLILHSVSDVSSGNRLVDDCIAKWMRNQFSLSSVTSKRLDDGFEARTLICEKPARFVYPVIVNELVIGEHIQESPTGGGLFGTNAILLHINISDTDLSKAKERLKVILSIVPSNSIPLLFVAYWCGNDQNDKLTKELNLDGLVKSRLISRYQIVYFGSVSSARDSSAAPEKLVRSLDCTKTFLRQPPELVDAFQYLAIMRLLPLFEKHIEYVCAKSFASFEHDRYEVIDILSHPLLALCRTFLVLLRNASTHHILESIPWPFDDDIKEYPLPDLEWNSSRRLKVIGEYLDKYINGMVLPDQIRSLEDLALYLNQFLLKEHITISRSKDTATAFKSLWDSFIHKLLESIYEFAPNQFICLKSSADAALTSWKYELARASYADVSIAIGRKRRNIIDSPKPSRRNRESSQKRIK